MALKTFDFKKVALIIGTLQASGFADDNEAISVEPDADLFTPYVGADGETSRAASNNQNAKLMAKFAQTSEYNAYLTGLIASKAAVPVLLKDASGNTLYASEQAFISKKPKAGFGKETGTREYELYLVDYTGGEGGN